MRSIPVLFAVAIAVPACATAQQSAISLDTGAVRRFVDSVITSGMERERIPGAAFVLVKDGRVQMMKGYGVADVARRTRVAPESTIFRIGSISKVFTAVALVQLADRGRIDMLDDVNRYLRRIRVGSEFAEPVTGEQLLDHTAGFDEIRPGTQAPTAGAVLPLAEFLTGKLIRVRPPGRTISYSTYGITLAGEMIEEVSGGPFESYLAREVWGPLGMTRTNITVPQSLASSVATGYDAVHDSVVEAQWEWYHTTPASSVNTTAADMARFMIAMLNDGAIGDARILSPRAARYMQVQHVTMHPRIPGVALGLYEDFVGDVRVLEHGGQVAGFSSQMVLVPEAKLGFFIVSHLENGRLRDVVRQALLGELFPAARMRLPVAAPPADFATRAARFAGRYAPITSCHSCTPRSVPAILTVTANADGTLGFTGSKWIEVAPLLFVREGGTGYISFRADSSGTTTQMFAGGVWSWERLPSPGGGGH